MTPPRPTPFDLVFGALAPERFPVLRDAVAAAGCDPRERDAFLMLREPAELLRELRPDEGMGASLHALAALLHQAYLFWMHGASLRSLSGAELAGLLADPAPRPSREPGPQASYLQLPALRVWGAPVEGQPPEPLDGWFVTRSGDQLSLLAVFGLSPARGGFTAVELAGPRPGTLQRVDGSPLFSPVLAGGAAAGLASVIGEAELLELAWRAEAVA